MSELERTLTMKLNHALYRFKQLAQDQKENAKVAGPYTKKRLEYCAAQIEATLKVLSSELPRIKWLEVD